MRNDGDNYYSIIINEANVNGATVTEITSKFVPPLIDHMAYQTVRLPVLRVRTVIARISASRMYPLIDSPTALRFP